MGRTHQKYNKYFEKRVWSPKENIEPGKFVIVRKTFDGPYGKKRKFFSRTRVRFEWYP